MGPAAHSTPASRDLLKKEVPVRLKGRKPLHNNHYDGPFPVCIPMTRARADTANEILIWLTDGL